MPLSSAAERRGPADPRSSSAPTATMGRSRAPLPRSRPPARGTARSRAGLPRGASAGPGRAGAAPARPRHPQPAPPIPPLSSGSRGQQLRHLPGAAMVRGWRGRGRSPSLTSPAERRGASLPRPLPRPRPGAPSRRPAPPLDSRGWRALGSGGRSARDAPCRAGHRPVLPGRYPAGFSYQRTDIPFSS